MPVVPYERQVSLGRVPGAPLQGVQATDAGAQAKDLGQGLSNLGQSISKIELAEAERANNLRVQDAGNQAVSTLTQLSGEFAQLRGADAMKPDESGNSPLQQYQSRLKSGLNAIRITLGNDAQKAAFDQHASSLMDRFGSNASSHVVAQQKVYNDSVQEGTIATSRQLIAANPADAAVVDEGIKAIRFAVGEKARGLAPEMIQSLQDEAVSSAHSATIKSMLDSNNAEGALAYFDKYKDTIVPLERAKIKAGLDQEAAVTLSIKAVDDVWSSQGPKDPTDPVRIADMEAALREKYGKEPDTLKASIADLRSRASAWNAQQSELKASNAARIWDLVDSGSGVAAIQRTPEWRAMSGTERHDILSRIEADQTTRANRAAAVSARQLTDLQRQDRLSFLTHADKFLQMSDPSVLAGMSRNQVAAMRTTFGVEKTEELLNRYDTIVKNGVRDEKNITALKLADDELEAAAWKNGILPSGKTFAKASQKEQDAFMKFRDGVQARVNDFEQSSLGGKRKATPQEVRQVTDAYLSDQAFVPGGWTWSGYDKNKMGDPTPIYKMSPEDLSKAVVQVGAERVKLADIPPDFRASAQAALVRRGRPVTQQALAEMWIWQQNQGKTPVAPTEAIPK